MSYAKGRRFEWKVRDYLKARGYVVIRAAASKPVDLVALRPGEILLVECKYNSPLTKARKRELLELARASGAKVVIASKRKNEKKIHLTPLTETL